MPISGGKRIPWWVAGLSIFATMLSAITFMAIPAKAYAGNMNSWIGMWPMALIIPLVVYCYLPFFRKLSVTSAYEFLEQRFNLASRLIASALFMLFRVGRVAIVLYLPALALSSVTDIDIYLAILSIGILCIAYTVMGGLEAVVWTDAIQAIVLLGGALLCILVIVFQMEGGLGSIIEVTQSDSKLLTADGKLGFRFLHQFGVGYFAGLRLRFPAFLHRRSGRRAALRLHPHGKRSGPVPLAEHAHDHSRFPPFLQPGRCPLRLLPNPTCLA